MPIRDCQCFFYSYPEKFLFVDILPIPYGEFSPYFKGCDSRSLTQENGPL